MYSFLCASAKLQPIWVKLAEIDWNFADTKKGIHKTLGQFISIYWYFLPKFGSLFYTRNPIQTSKTNLVTAGTDVTYKRIHISTDVNMNIFFRETNFVFVFLLLVGLFICLFVCLFVCFLCEWEWWTFVPQDNPLHIWVRCVRYTVQWGVV